MTITVSGPEGVSVQFPDGTDASTIHDVMLKHFGGGQKEQGNTDPRFSNMVAEKGLEGVPILGGLVPKAGAAISAAVQPLTGAGAEGGTFGERYSKNLQQETSASEAFDKEHPLLSTAAQLTGGALATAPVAATGLGARVLGIGGQTLPGQIIRSGASGAGINAIDALVRGNDPGMAAGIGGAIGAAAPPAARLAGAIVSPVAATVRGILAPRAEAERRVGNAIARGQELNQAVPGSALTPQEFQQMGAQGEPVILADVAGEPGRALMRSAANQSPEARAVQNAAVNERFETQAPRFAAEQQGQLNYPTQALRDQAINEVRQQVYEPAYAQAWRDSRGVPLWPDRDLINARAQDYNRLQELLQRRQAGPPLNAQEQAELRNLQARGVQNLPPFNPQQTNALNNLRDIAQSPDVQQAIPAATLMHRNYAVRDGFSPPAAALGIDRSGTVPTVRPTQTQSGNMNMPSLQYWDYIKRQLDQMGTPTSPSYARLLRNSLDTLVPSYAQARAAAQPTKFFNGAANAYEGGQNFINRGTTFGPEAQQNLQRMDPRERALFQDGYTNALIDRIVNNTADRRTITARVFNNPNARAEITSALGPQRAAQIETRLHLENLMDAPRQALQGNSTTVRQLVELGLAGGVGLVEGGNPANWDSETIMHAALMYAAARGQGHIDQRVAGEVARLLTSRDPQLTNLGVNWIARNPRLLGGLRSLGVGLARSGAVQAQQAQ